MRLAFRFGFVLSGSFFFLQPLVAQGGIAAVAGGVSNDAAARPAVPAYSWTVQTHRLQMLGDGTTITADREESFYRDSHGRTRMDMPDPPEVATGPARRRSTIWDPVAHVNIELYPAVKLANVTRNRTVEARQEQQAFFAALMAATKGDRPEPEYQRTETEDLGDSTILDYPVHGRRFVRVIEAGKIGNDRPIRIVQEEWTYKLRTGPHSTQAISLRSIVDDPRTGRMERVATRFDPQEPDPSVFQVPSDYKVFGDTKALETATQGSAP